MLIQLLAQHPQAIVTVVRNTPTWVWGLLAMLVTLAATQLRDRTASLLRISVMPVAMTAFSVWGTVSAFSASPLFGQAVALWLGAATLLFGLIAFRPSPVRYDAATRTYALPGSALPLALVVGIFLVKYVVGVDLAMAPQLIHDSQYTLTVAALYGAFTGSFIGRAARLWRLALRNPAASAAA